MTMAASVYATPPPDLSGEEAALSDASNSSQTNSSHGSALKASKRTLSSSFLNATTANTTQSSTITTTSSSQQSSDSLPDLSKKRRKQSMPIRFATNGALIEPSSTPSGEPEDGTGRLAETGGRSGEQNERDRRIPNDNEDADRDDAEDDDEDDGCQSPNPPSPAMETDQDADESAALLEQQQNNFQKIFLSNLSQLQQKHLQLQQQQHAAGESGLGSPGTSLPDSFLASKLTSLISMSSGRGMKSDDEQEGDEPEHRQSSDMVGSNSRSSNSKENYNGSVENEELKSYHEESLRAGNDHHAHGERSSNHSPSPMMSNPPKISLKKELMFDPEWDGEIRSNLPKPEDWMSIAGLSFPFPPEAAAALSASGYLPQLPLLGVPTVSPFGGGSTDGSNRPSVPPLRIFNPEAYCDLCNKEFCNKYFLKTHKANKHGIYEPAANSSNSSDNNPPSFSALMNPFNPIHQLSQVFQMQQQQQQQQHSGPASSSSEQLEKHSGGQNTVGHQLGRDTDAQVSQQSPAMSQAPHQQSAGPPAPASSMAKASAQPTSRTTSLSPKNPTNSTSALIQPTVFCDICFKKFSSLSAMRKHRSKAHELANQNNHQQQLQQQLQQHHQQQLQQQQQQLQQQLHQHLQQQHQHYQQQLHSRSIDGGKHESSADIGGGVSGNNEGSTGPPSAITGGPFQLPDGFREDYMVEQEDTSFTPQPRKLSPHSMQAAKDANFSADKLKRLGVINTEAFCEICCKEYCNKYFLRTHKLKRHGILPTADELKEERNLPWVPFMQTSPLNLIMGGSAATAADMVSAQMALQASSPSSLKKFMAAAAAASAAGELVNGADNNSGPIDGTNGGSSMSPHEIKQELQGKGRGMSNGDGSDAQGSSQDAGAGDGDDRNSATAGQKDIGSDEDAEAISVDLQKLQSMIMQLNDLNNQHQRKMCCGVCGKELANQYLLHAHMIQEHGPLGENNNGGLKGSREPTPLTSITATGTPAGAGAGEMMEVCKQCDKEFSNEYMLKQHLIEVHGLPSIPSPKREGFITPERRTTGGNSGGGAGGTAGSTTGTTGTPSGPPPAPNYNDRKPTFSMTPTSSYCEICNKELCNKYFMKTHMQRMHGIEIENGAQIGGVVCNICNKELCSKYFLRVHKHNTHGIVEEGAPLPQARQNGGAAAASGGGGGATGASGVTGDSPMMGAGGSDPNNDGTDPSGLLKPGEITDTSNRYYSHFTEVCPLCSRRFRSAKWLRAHLLSDHGKPGVDKLKELEQKLANGPGSVGQTGASNGGGRSKSSSPSLKVPNGGGSGGGGMVEPKFNSKSPFGAISPAEAAKFLPKSAGIPGLFGTEQTPSPMGGMKGYQCSFCTFATPLLPLLFIHERSHSSLTIVQQQLLQQQQHQQQQQQQQEQQQQQSDEGLGSPMGEATFPTLLKSESAVSLAKEHSAHHQTLPGTNSSSVGSSSETPSSTPASTPVPSLSQEALNLQQQHQQQQQRSRSGSRYELRQSPDPEPTSRMTELAHLKPSSPKVASAPSPAIGGGGEPNAMLTEMANITQRPAIYALPQQSGPLMMQSFLIEESSSSFGAAGNRSPKDSLSLTGHDHRFVPAVVFLPVKERILTPMTISFNLSPA